jgi:hypothetical protein
VASDHKFKIGQTVLFRPRANRGINIALNHPYQVTRRLPVAGGQHQYRIRCTATHSEFAASESELQPATAR